MTDPSNQATPASADVPSVGPTGPTGAVEVIRSEERLSVSTSWEPYRRVRVGKRIIEETRTVTVEVRREELVVEEFGVEELQASAATGGTEAGTDRSPLAIEFDLYEEQITITRVVVPIERVRVDIERVAAEVTVSSPLAHEEIAIEPAKPANLQG